MLADRIRTGKAADAVAPVRRREKLRTNAPLGVGAVLYTGLNYFGQRFFAFRYDLENEEN